MKEKLKIGQIHTGTIRIPPNGWGAVEEIIWQYCNALKRKGHTCDIVTFNQNLEDYDILHVHMANQAIELKKRNLPHFFTDHDICPLVQGIESELYKQHVEAIKGSIKTFFASFYYAQFYRPYYYRTRYMPHGVDTEFFSKKDNTNEKKRLLCVGKNGMWGDTHDCKGFEEAHKIAIEAKLPLTIAGPNEKWFEDHDYDFRGEDINIINKNLTKEELRDLYHSHDILVHMATVESGQPCLVILEAMSCGLPVVATYRDPMIIPGVKFVWRVPSLAVKAIGSILKQYDSFSEQARNYTEAENWDVVADRLEDEYLFAHRIQKKRKS